jgi:hypothetical protein
MKRTKAGLTCAFLMGMALGGAQALLPYPAYAQEDDPGLIRTLEIDSAQVENAYYLEATFDNDSSSHRLFYLYGEGLFALAKDFGLEADFPTLDTAEPLGQGPAILGPIGLYLRYEFYHFGGWSSETAGAFSIEAGAAYGFFNKTFPWIGSSWTIEALGGYRVEKFFLQGNYCYTGGIDPQVPNQWQANTGLGYHLGSDWYIQTEADFTAFTGPFNGSSWTFIPQVAFQPGEWLFELGEALNESPAGVTELMVARTF